MNSIRLWTLFFGLMTAGFAGNSQDRPIHFRASVQGGITQGPHHNSIVLQSTTGIQKESWLASLGLGYDGYAYHTLPLFLEVRKFFGSEQTLFFYGASGYNFPVGNKPNDNLWYYDNYSFYGGIYTNFGVGFAVPLTPKSWVIFSIGHSYKKLHADMYYNVCGDCEPVTPDHFIFGYGRLELKTGIMF